MAPIGNPNGLSGNNTPSHLSNLTPTTESNITPPFLTRSTSGSNQLVRRRPGQADLLASGVSQEHSLGGPQTFTGASPTNAVILHPQEQHLFPQGQGATSSVTSKQISISNNKTKDQSTHTIMFSNSVAIQQMTETNMNGNEACGESVQNDLVVDTEGLKLLIAAGLPLSSLTRGA